MSDIQYWDDTLVEELDAIRQMIDKVGSLQNAMEKQAAVDRAKSRLRSAAGTKRSFKMEIRLIQDVKMRRKYEARYAQLDEQIKTLQQDLKALETESARGELFISSGRNGNMDGDEMEGGGLDPQRAGDNMLKEASALQDKTQDSLANTKQMIQQSKEVGAATLEELERQRRVIENIDKEADRIDDNLARAELLLKQFGKRMASDQFIQCFAVINCLLLLGVVFYAIFGKSKLGNSTGGTPTNPFLRN